MSRSDENTPLALTLVIVAVSSLVVACGSDDESPASGSGGAPGAAGTAGDAGSAGTGGVAGAAGASGNAGEAGAGGDPDPPGCPTFDDGTETGTVASQEIDEASGLVWSRRNDGVLWLHNDSGDSARLFALDLAGTHVAELGLPGQWARDWEDMALGPGPDGDHDLFLGDIGDNAEARDDIVVFRAEEPEVDLASAPVSGTLDDVAVLRFTYPGGQAHNAETLICDPETGDLYVVTKKDSGLSEVFRAAAPHADGETAVLESVANLAFGPEPLEGGLRTTAGDVTQDGAWVAIRTYGSAFAWYRAPGTPLWTAFAADPCPLPLRSEPQGETFAWSPQGDRYATISEGSSQPVYVFEVEP